MAKGWTIALPLGLLCLGLDSRQADAQTTAPASAAQTTAQAPVPATSAAITTTRDIKFTSHDGYDMVGRLTLPDTPGLHPVLVLVQTAEAAAMDPQTRNARGERVNVYNIYRENLTPLNIGFFTYEGRGVFSSGTGGRQIDRTVYDTSTLENKVRDAIAAVRVLQKEPGVDTSQMFLRGISEGSLLAADVATRIPKEIKGLVLSGVMGTTMKDALKFMAGDGFFMQHREQWDANKDGRISLQEFEADPKGIRKQMPENYGFVMFDVDNDGVYTVTDSRTMFKPIADAIEAENFEAFEPWLRGTQAVPLPDPMRAWLKEHFSHAPMWDLVSQLAMPVGFFQGDLDGNTPAEAVRTLEQKAKSAGKTNLEFYFFPDLNHGVGTAEYFALGRPSAAYAAIFDFMKRHAPRR